jgi:hypothetical protein
MWLCIQPTQSFGEKRGRTRLSWSILVKGSPRLVALLVFILTRLVPPLFLSVLMSRLEFLLWVSRTPAKRTQNSVDSRECRALKNKQHR